MLVRAVSSIALERRLFGSTAGKGDGGRGGSLAAGGGGGGSPLAQGSENGGEDLSAYPGLTTLPTVEQSLTEWLEGRVPEVSHRTRTYFGD